MYWALSFSVLKFGEGRRESSVFAFCLASRARWRAVSFSFWVKIIGTLRFREDERINPLNALSEII